MSEIDPRVKILLNDIYVSAERIVEQVQNKTLEGFASDIGIDAQDIVARRLTIVGEASAALLRKHLEFCERHPEIPLQEARAMRNVLVHDYNRINWEVVWKTSRKELPKLIDAIKPFLDK